MMKSRIQTILLIFSIILVLSIVLFTEIITTARAVDEASPSITDTETRSISRQEEAAAANLEFTVIISGGSDVNNVTQYPLPPYDIPQTITLTAVPDVAWRFDHWEGDLTGSDSPKDLFLTGSEVVTATFELRCFTLTLSKTGYTGPDGTPVPDKANSPSCPTTGQYVADEIISFSTTVPPHWTIDSWTGTDGDTIPTLTMPAADHLVAVNYTPICFTLTTNVLPLDGGAIDRLPGSDCPPPGLDTDYHEGTEVSLTANPSAGYAFTNWVGAPNSNPPTQTLVTMNDHLSVTANFELCFTLTLSKTGYTGPDGTPVPYPANSLGCSIGQYVSGERINFFTNVPLHWTIDSWTGTDDGTSTLTMPATDHLVTVNYTPVCFTLTTNVLPIDGGAIDRSPGSDCPPPGLDTDYHEGTEVSLTPFESLGFEFLDWGGDVSGSVTPTLVTMNEHRSVTANFALACYPLILNRNDTNWGSVPTAAPTNSLLCNPGEYKAGEEITLDAVPANGYQIESWDGTTNNTEFLSFPALPANGDHTVTVNYIKKPTLEFSLPSYSIKEYEITATVTVSRTGSLIEDVSVKFATSDGSASNEDYQPISDWLPFAPGVEVNTFEVLILDDNIAEGPESLNLTLSSPQNGAILGEQSTAELTIQDDEGPPTVQFEPTAYEAVEASSSIPVTITLYPPSANSVFVKFKTIPGTASSGEDYDGEHDDGQTLEHFEPGQTIKNIEITLINDNLDEFDETVHLQLPFVFGADLAPGQSEATLTILDDDDPPSVQFSANRYFADEGDPMAPLTVTLSAATSLTVTVDYTAEVPNGQPIVGNIIFNPGEVSKTIDIPIANNQADDILFATLRDVENASLASPSIASLTILGKARLNFSAAIYEVDEDAGSAAISVKRSGSLNEQVTVAVRTSDDSAAAGQDYVTISDTLSFPKDIDEQTFTVTILDDGTSEATESVNLSLFDASANAELGPHAEAVLKILDNESGPTVQFSTTTYEAAESSSTIRITLTLSPRSADSVYVDFDTQARTATSEVDYYDVAKTIHFKPDEASRYIEISLIDDNLDEIDETVQLQLSHVEGANLGASEALLTIIDDDDPPSVQFSAGAYFAEVGDPTAPLTVTLSVATFLTVTVDYTVDKIPNGQPIVGKIRFYPGVVSQTIDVPIVDNKAKDNFLAQLSGVENASLAYPYSASLTINAKVRSDCYLLTLNHTGYGGPPIPNKPQSDDCPAGRYFIDDEISLLAQPDPGWFIDRWQGTQNDDDAVPENEAQVLMPDGDHSVTAYYFTSTYLPYVSKDYMVFFDGPVEVEPNNLLKTSQANGLLRSGQLYYGSFPTASDDYDVFFFNLTAKGTVQIDLMDIPAGRDYNLYLFSSDGVRMSFSGSVDNQNEQIISSNLDLGLYFVAIENAEGAPTTARYSLTVDFE